MPLGALRSAATLRGECQGGRWRDLEGGGNEAGVFGAGDVVEVAHGGGDVCVAHPLFDAKDVGLGDGAGAEGVAEVVEAEGPETGSVEGELVAAAKRRAVEVAAVLAEEDEGVSVAAAPRRASVSATWGAIGTERSLPLLSVVSAPAA